MRMMVDGTLTGIVVMHVDDVLFAGGISVSKIVVKALNDTLRTKHLGRLTWYMGIEFKRDRKAGTIEMSQSSYIRSILERFNVFCTSLIPASPSVNLRAVNENNVEMCLFAKWWEA